jgi:hypothetical protein
VRTVPWFTCALQGTVSRLVAWGAASTAGNAVGLWPAARGTASAAAGFSAGLTESDLAERPVDNSSGEELRMDYGQIRMDPDDAERIWRLAVATELRADDEQLALLRLARQVEWTSPQHAGLVAEAEKTRKVRTLTTTHGTTQG